MRMPGIIVVLFTRARVRIVRRRIEKKPPQAIPAPPLCGLECPSAEEMAEYIDGRLSGYRRIVIDEHLCDCVACFEVYLGVLRFQLEGEIES